jgi:hypothetical protein
MTDSAGESPPPDFKDRRKNIHPNASYLHRRTVANAPRLVIM